MSMKSEIREMIMNNNELYNEIVETYVYESVLNTNTDWDTQFNISVDKEGNVNSWYGNGNSQDIIDGNEIIVATITNWDYDTYYLEDCTEEEIEEIMRESVKVEIENILDMLGEELEYEDYYDYY